MCLIVYLLRLLWVRQRWQLCLGLDWLRRFTFIRLSWCKCALSFNILEDTTLDLLADHINLTMIKMKFFDHFFGNSFWSICCCVKIECYFFITNFERHTHLSIILLLVNISSDIRWNGFLQPARCWWCIFFLWLRITLRCMMCWRRCFLQWGVLFHVIRLGGCAWLVKKWWLLLLRVTLNLSNSLWQWSKILIRSRRLLIARTNCWRTLFI